MSSLKGDMYILPFSLLLYSCIIYLVVMLCGKGGLSSPLLVLLPSKSLEITAALLGFLFSLMLSFLSGMFLLRVERGKIIFLIILFHSFFVPSFLFYSSLLRGGLTVILLILSFFSSFYISHPYFVFFLYKRYCSISRESMESGLTVSSSGKLVLLEGVLKPFIKEIVLLSLLPLIRVVMDIVSGFSSQPFCVEPSNTMFIYILYLEVSYFLLIVVISFYSFKRMKLLPLKEGRGGFFHGNKIS